MHIHPLLLWWSLHVLIIPHFRYSSTPSPRDAIQHSLHRRLNYGGRDMQSSISKEIGADQPSNTASSSGSSKSRLKQTDLKSKVAHDSHTSYDELSPKRRRKERAGGDKRHRVQSATREESAASGSTRSERSQSNDARHKTPSSHRELSSGLYGSGDLTRRHGQTEVPPLKQRRVCLHEGGASWGGEKHFHYSRAEDGYGDFELDYRRTMPYRSGVGSTHLYGENSSGGGASRLSWQQSSSDSWYGAESERYSSSGGSERRLSRKRSRDWHDM